MTAEQLRNSILQQAISGRLVPQDPNDEPASALLARIRQEKDRLIKEKKLKKDKPSSPITEDEIPFEIPASWEWVRLGSIFFTTSGGTPAKGHPEYYTNGTIPWIKSGELKEKYLYDSEEKITETALQNSSAKYFPEGTVAVAMYGATIGKTSIFKAKMTTNQAICGIFPNNHILPEYIYYFIQAKVKDYLSMAFGSGQPNISQEKIKETLLPLPPLSEQLRIVAKLEELLPIVEQYGKAQTELDELNAALPSRLRQSILQQAIQGKLVPQDEAESVNELVHRLQNALNVSPYKKKWNTEEISEDELPFDIPENWQWMRLGDIVYTQTGLSYSKGDLEKKVPNPIRILRGGNIQNGAWCIKDDDVMIAPEFVKKDIFLKKNSFITPAVTSLEHLGKTALIREDHNDIVAGGFVLYLMPYDATNDELMEYLAYFFQSAFYNSFCKTITNKSGQAFWNISREKLLKLPIPLPPLAEQQRIVAKIEELFAEIDRLQK